MHREISPNWILGAFDASKPPLDSYVDLLWRKAREEDKSRWEVLDKIERMHKDELKHMEKFVFKHLDIAESLEIVGGKLSEGFSAKEVKEIMLKLLGD